MAAATVAIDLVYYAYAASRLPLGLGAVAWSSLVSLAFALILGAGLGLVFGGLLALSVPATGPRRSFLEALRARLFEGTLEERAATSGAFLTSLALLAGASIGCVLVAERLIVDMARADYAAIAVVGTVFGSLIVSGLLFVPLRALAALALIALGQIRYFGVLVRTPARVLAIVSVAALGATVAFLFVFWQPLSYLPWREGLQVLASAAFAAVFTTLLRSRRGRPLALLERALVVPAVLACLVSIYHMTPADTEVRSFVQQNSLLGGVGYRVAWRLLDFDKDGDIHLLGGGDCAPFDASIHSGAVDVPNNGVDEDCDGRELNSSELPSRGEANFPVPAAVPRKPSVVFVTIDAFGARYLAALGEKRNITPNLNALAARSAVFTRCFSQGPSTRLSFPSMFTSRWDSQIRRTIVGRHPFPIHADEVLLAEVIRDHGYRTVAVLGDKYFLPSRWKGLTSGFERVNESATRGTDSHRSGRVTDAALKEVDRAAEEPLFLWVHYFDAHGPHVQPQGVKVIGTSEEDRYLSELALVDREVGRLLDGIRERLGEQAVIVVSADHGIAFDKPRHEKKHYGFDLHSVITHVPLIVQGPFIERRTFRHAVSTMDIAPTITNLLRVSRRLPFEGTSLVPELFEGVPSRPQLLLHQYYVPDRIKRKADPLDSISVRNDRFHLMLSTEDSRLTLYDYVSDYWERNDLSLRPEHQQVFRDLRDQLSLFRHELGLHHGRSSPGTSAKDPRSALSP